MYVCCLLTVLYFLKYFFLTSWPIRITQSMVKFTYSSSQKSMLGRWSFPMNPKCKTLNCLFKSIKLVFFHVHGYKNRLSSIVRSLFNATDSVTCALISYRHSSNLVLLVSNEVKYTEITMFIHVMQPETRGSRKLIHSSEIWTSNWHNAL